ncbi:hypothetical protein LIER_21973 [Lithospermum erythrorhizon]|uniref:Uncharacterized protein n=1 Tax=Lithospermum erythrorhizon TaxID=34254 RepID=A0AAV3QWC0_LITER
MREEIPGALDGPGHKDGEDYHRGHGCGSLLWHHWKTGIVPVEALVSLIHMKMKFPMRYWAGEIQGNQKKERGCYLASMKRIKAHMKIGSSSKRVEEAHDRNVCTLQVLEESLKKGNPDEDVWSMPFDARDPKSFFKMGTTLGGIAREYAYLGPPGVPRYIFVQPKDIPGVDPGGGGPSTVHGPSLQTHQAEENDLFRG